MNVRGPACVCLVWLAAAALLPAPQARGDAADYVYEFAPEAVGKSGRVASASKFVWAADSVATNGIVSYYRQKFTLPAKPAKAMLTRRLDDKGEVYVNGHALEGHRTVTSYLAAGDNTIAVALTNALSVSAMIYILECTDGNGGTSYIHSDASVKGTVKTPAGGWEQKDFDDSAWPNVTIIGDAFADPWVFHYDMMGLVTPGFMTPEEVARALPDGRGQEPDPAVRVAYHGARPYIEINGVPHAPQVNNCQINDAYNDSAIVRLSKAGFRIVQLSFAMDDFYKGEGSACDFSPVNAAVCRLLRLDPDAYVMMSLRFTMRDWAASHPDEQVGYATGASDSSASDECRERVVRPSAASARFRTLALGMIREFSEYVAPQPWAKRLIGIRPGYGADAEWCCYGFQDAPDTGLRMQEKFREYMLAKRGVADAQIPALAVRRHESSIKDSLNGDLLDPAEDQIVLDYYDCLANTMADLLLAMAAETRQDFPGRLVGACYGHLFSDNPPEGANVLLDKVLSNPNIDFLSNAPYRNPLTHLAGGSYAPRTTASLFRRYGKLSLLEDDSRFHHVREWLKTEDDGVSLVARSAQETEMNMRRNWLNQFFDGDGMQLNDAISSSGKRPHAFDDPAVFKAIDDSRAALDAAGSPASLSGNRVAVVLSPRELMRRDGGKCSSFTWNLYQTTLQHLNRSGVAFDMLTLEDYVVNPQDYNIVLFLNAFYLTAEERTRLVDLTRRRGMTAVWFGPAGGVTDDGFSDEAMSDLIGFAAVGAARRPMAASSDSLASSVCSGHAFAKDLASGARSILVPEFPSGDDSAPAIYASILREAGAWAYTAPGSYFRRHGDVFMLHTGTPGQHRVSLPDDVVKVTELFSGAEFSSGELILQSDGPRTWLFRASTRGPWSVGDSVVASLDADGLLSFSGDGAMCDFADAADAPWNPASVTGVSIGHGVSLGANALAALPDGAMICGQTLGGMRSALGVGEDYAQGDDVVVSKSVVEPADVASLDVVGGAALLGISVCTNASRAGASARGQVMFKAAELSVSEDGLRILAPIPADAEHGFMILRRGGVRARDTGSR